MNLVSVPCRLRRCPLFQFIICSLPVQDDDNIYVLRVPYHFCVFYISSTPFEQPKTRGIQVGDKGSSIPSGYISSLVPDFLGPQQTTQEMTEIFSENHEETFVFWKKCNVGRNDAKMIWTLSQTTRKTERKARFNLVRSTNNAIQPNTTTV